MTIIDRPNLTGHDDIDATIAGLHALAAWRNAHPEIDGILSGTIYIVTDWRNPDATPADIVRAISDGAAFGSVTKTPGNANPLIMFIDRKFSDSVKIQYQADRDEVCTRRVTGTETVQVPDPDAPLITVEREVVEWDCAPILAGA